jgi:glutathione S-transferase
LIQQWAIYAMTEIEPPAIQAIRSREKAPEAAAKASARAGKAVGVVERALSGSPPRLVGDRLTIADIVAGETLRLMTKYEGIEASPAIDAYLSDLAERPAHQRALERLNAT